MLKSQPTASPTSSIRKPRKPRRANVRLVSPSTSGQPSAPVYYKPEPIAAPSPAWGPSYYKERPGFRRTLESLRSSIGNDQNTSYILGDLLEQRYGKMSDIRDKWFSDQRAEAEHQYNLADVYAREGEDYDINLPEIDGIPKGEGPQALMKQLMAEIAQHPGDQKYAEGISGVYQDRIEDAMDIKNNIRDYNNSVQGYERNHENYLEELAARGEGFAGPDNPDPTAIDTSDPGAVARNPYASFMQGWTGKTPQQQAVGQIGEGFNNVLDFGMDLTSGKEAEGGILDKAIETAVPPSLLGQDTERDIEDFLKGIKDEQSDALWWTLDKFSRPFYGMAHGLDKANEIDTDDEKSQTKMIPVVGSWLEAMNSDPLGTADELFKNPSKIGDIIKANLHGMTSGGLGMSDDPLWFDEVIKNEAERDEEKNFFDNRNYQVWAGGTGSVILDPLNVMGFGLLKAPKTIADTLKGADKLQHAADVNRIKWNAGKIEKYFDDTEWAGVPFKDETYTAKEVEDLLLGTETRSTGPANYSDQTANMARIQRNTDQILSAMEARRVPQGGRAAELADLRASLSARREKIINETGFNTYMDEVARDIGVSSRKGNQVDDLDEITSTAAIASRFDEAARYERMLNKAAKDKFDVDEWSQVQAQYDNMLEGYQAGNISKKNLDDFRNSIDDALDEVPTRLRDINEVMGGSFRADPRWTDAEARTMVQQADRLSSKDAKVAGANVARGSIQSRITILERLIETNKKAGKSITGLQRAVEQHKAALYHNNKEQNLRRADYFVRLLKSHVETQAGKVVYADVKQATALRELRDAIAKQRESGTQSSHIATASDRDPTLIKRDKQGNAISTPAEYDEFGVKSMPKSIAETDGGLAKGRARSVTDISDPKRTMDMSTDAYSRAKSQTGDKIAENRPDELLIRNADGSYSYDPALLQSNDKYMDMGHQLDELDKQARAQLEFMRYTPDKPWNAIPNAERVLSDVPVAFRDVETGEIEFDKLAQHFKIDKWKGPQVKRTGDEATDQWLGEFSAVLENKYHEIHGKKYDSWKRRANEKRALRAEAEIIKEASVEEKQMLTMFTHSSEGGKNLQPFVTIGGEKVAKGSRFKELTNPAPGDKRSAAADLATARAILADTDEVPHQAVGRLRDRLHESNLNVPRNIKQATEWIKSRIGSVELALDPHEYAFRRMFKEEHGMTLRDAQVRKDVFLGKAAKLDHGAWAKRYPHGVTHNEFLSAMTESADTLYRMTHAGPFRIRVNNRVSPAVARANEHDFKIWAKGTHKDLMKMTPEARRRVLDRAWSATLKQQVAARGKNAPDRKALLDAKIAEMEKAKPTPDWWNRTREDSYQEAWKSARNELESGTLSTGVANQEFKLMKGIDDLEPDEIFNIMKYRLGEEEATLRFEKTVAQSQREFDEIRRIDNELQAIQVRRAAMAERHKTHLAQSNLAKAKMKKYLEEDAYLRMASLHKAGVEKSLSFNVLNKAMQIPGSKYIFKATEELGGLAGIKQARQAWSDLFISPASKLEPTLQLARARALGQTPIIIEHDVKQLQKIWSRIDIQSRKRGLKMFLKGVDTDTPEVQAVMRSFDDTFMEHFQNRVKIGDSYLSLAEINKYLPADMKMMGVMGDKARVFRFDTPQDLLRNVMGNKKNVKSLAKDPYRVAWEMRIAVHQAAARKASEQFILTKIGVRKPSKGQPGFDAINKLKSKAGWTEISSLHNGYLFHPDVVEDVRNFFKMLEPREIESFGRLMDRATGYWKTATTIYNPGYWARNAVGEAMSSWLAGVHGVKPYEKAMKVVGYARKDGQELEALGKQFSFLNYKPSESIKGNQTLGITAGGHKLTPENVWVLYNDRGIKTGFFNTEFDNQYSMLGNKLRTNPVTSATSAGHVKMRSMGEWYEDYFRLAHFVHALERSPAKSLEKAADMAAAEVRKYHFDYTDFTNFEKTVMLRTFPFYKWTRKAIPLMMTMLFTKPGKIAAYPKIMNTVSNSVSTHDIGGDDNGLAPNYEGIVPSWIQDLWAYQIPSIGEEGEQDAFGQGNETYFNLATPQMDSYKALTHPGNTAYGLLNPFAKVVDQQGAEQLSGNSIGDLLGANNYEFKDAGDHANSLAKLTPQTNFLEKLLTGPSAEEVLTYGTGLGLYENNNIRRVMELQDQDK